MSTTRKIAHNTMAQIVGKVFSTLFGLLAIGMMTRYLGQEKFGWYITTLTFLQFVAILVDFGLVPVTAQMMSEPEHDKPALLKNLLGYRLVTAAIFLGIAPFVALLLPYPMEVKIAISFTTINMLAVAINQVFIGFLQVKLKMHFAAIGEVVGRVVLVICLWFLIDRHAGFIQVMIAVTLASVAYTVVLWVKTSKIAKLGFAYDKEIWKSITIKMWPIAISIIFNVIYLKGDTLLLSLFRPQTEVALYGAAYRVIDVLAQMAMMLMGIMLPLLAYHWSRKMTGGFRKHYQQSFDMMMLIVTPMVVGTLVLAKPIMTLIAGKEFIASGDILQILILGIFGLYMGAIFGHCAVAINKQKQTIWIYLSDAIITLTAYLIFIPIYGMYGAAWVTVFSELYAGILLFLTIRHYTKEKLRVQTFAKIIFSSLVMGGVLILFSHLHVLLLVPIGGVVYAGFLYGLGGISKETIGEILRLKNK